MPGVSSGKSSSGKHPPCGVLGSSPRAPSMWGAAENLRACVSGQASQDPVGIGHADGGRGVGRLWARRGRVSEGGGETEQVYLGDGGVELMREARPLGPSLWQGHPLHPNTGGESVKYFSGEWLDSGFTLSPVLALSGLEEMWAENSCGRGGGPP